MKKGMTWVLSPYRDMAVLMNGQGIITFDGINYNIAGKFVTKKIAL